MLTLMLSVLLPPFVFFSLFADLAIKACQTHTLTNTQVMLADVRTTPHGPNSLYETRRKMTLLEERVATCQAEAIKHILEGGSWEEEDYGEESDEEDKGEQGGGEKKEGEAGAAGTEAGQSQQGEGQIEGKKEETGPGAALRKVRLSQAGFS